MKAFWPLSRKISWKYRNLFESKALINQRIFTFYKTSCLCPKKQKFWPIINIISHWDDNSSENLTPRGIEESRNGKFTFLGDRGRWNLFLGVLGEFRGMNLSMEYINYKASIIGILIMLALNNINYKASIIGILIMLVWIT